MEIEEEPKELLEEKLLDFVYISNLLTSLDLIAFIPLLNLWSIEFTDNEQIGNAAFYFDPAEQKPKILFNRTWTRENIKTAEEFVTIFLHENLHFLLGYYGNTSDPYLVEAWECFINQAIHVITKGNSAYLGIIRRTFENLPFPQNFRCDSAKPKGYLQSRIYYSLYNYENPGVTYGISEEETSIKDYRSLGFSLPKPCFLLDPKTLADFFAELVPEKDRLPRTAEAWKEKHGQAPIFGEEIDKDHPLYDILKDSAVLGMSALGEGSGELSDSTESGDSLPKDRIISPELAATLLEKINKLATEDIKDELNRAAPPYSSTVTGAERRFKKKIPAKTQNNKYFPRRPLRDLINSALTDIANGRMSDVLFGRSAGAGGTPYVNTITERNKLFTNKSLLRKDLERVSTIDLQGKISCLLKMKVQKIPIKTPKPSFSRDRLATALLTQGRSPAMYRSSEKKNPKGMIHLYADVSGSCTEYIPGFLDFMEPMKDITYEIVHTFSTEIHEVQRDVLLRSRTYTSTGGTDFNCIIEHMKANGIRLGVIMSDGESSISTENKRWATDNHVTFVTLTTPNPAYKSDIYELSTIVGSLDNYIKDKKVLR